MTRKPLPPLPTDPYECLCQGCERPWEVANEPFQVAKDTFYVGNNWVGAYLLASDDGLALIDTTMQPQVYLVLENIRKLGFDPADIRKILISHMHYDHTGNNGLFPNARYHLQDAEMNFVTGRCMCHAQARGGFMIEDVVAMVRRLYDGHLCFHDGDEELFPGITLHHMPGHTRGLQAVSVKTKRGTVVLASDAAHFYAHIRQRRVFPFVDSITDVLEGYNKLEKLAPTLDHIVPGHDPLITQLYPAFKPETKGWIHRVDVDQAPFPSA